MTKEGGHQPEERIVPMRLQKFLARAGAASRRGSENLMTAGRVTVNGEVVTELGSKVDPLVDEVAVDGIVVRLADGPVTLMLHKPVGVLTTMSDPFGRPTVVDMVPTDRYPGLFPVGRLDQDTSGLLLFSTDGDLGNALLRPKGHVMKRYIALVEGRPSRKAIESLRRGVLLDDGKTLPAQVDVLEGVAARMALKQLCIPAAVPEGASPQYARACEIRAGRRSVVRLCIHEGRKRQVRRMLDFIGHPVVALHRDSFGPLELGSLQPGVWRQLSAEETAALDEAIGRGAK